MLDFKIHVFFLLELLIWSSLIILLDLFPLHYMCKIPSSFIDAMHTVFFSLLRKICQRYSFAFSVLHYIIPLLLLAVCSVNNRPQSINLYDSEWSRWFWINTAILSLSRFNANQLLIEENLIQKKREEKFNLYGGFVRIFTN